MPDSLLPELLLGCARDQYKRTKADYSLVYFLFSEKRERKGKRKESAVSQKTQLTPSLKIWPSDRPSSFLDSVSTKTQ